MLDFISELGSSVPWIYRGWIFLASNSYREETQLRWRIKGGYYKAFDVCASTAFMLAEIWLLAALLL
jgi:hypothetical protein